MGCFVLDFHEIDEAQAPLVGGKGAHLGELARIEDIRVPAGFCVTTDAFTRIKRDAGSIDDLLDRLSGLEPDDGEAIRALSAEIRQTIENTVIPDDLKSEIRRALVRYDKHAAYAVRSSATAEDLPTASFAGQQDTYLNVIGADAVLAHIRRCWASLFTERAVTYRRRNDIDDLKVSIAVVVQRMVVPEVSGVLFTADPLTGNRTVATIEACFGLGEALVSGLVSPDVYRVREGTVVERTVATKRTAIVPAPAGGTRTEEIASDRQDDPALNDAQVLRLTHLGRRIEAEFGRPQDIEWCLAEGEFAFVQSRPITTLFPIPNADDQGNHVYISVGHQQMMTDPMKPLGLSLFQLNAAIAMHEAAGRLFVDVTPHLSSSTSRDGLMAMVGRSDPLIGDALQTILDRGDFVPSLPEGDPGTAPRLPAAAPVETDPAIVTALIESQKASLAELEREIRTRSGSDLLDFILDDIQRLKQEMFDPRNMQAIMVGMESAWWLNDRLEAWLGEKNAADTLSQSVPNNVTAEMGLALLDVADVIRPYSEVVAFLERVADEDFLEELPEVPGGQEARGAILAWLEAYGMRGPGEIDITRPRWREQPTMLVPLILGNVRNFAPGAGKRRFEEGRQAAWEREQELLRRLRELPDGDQKANETKRMIDRVRAFSGYREYPKYSLISRTFLYKQALLEEAERLVRAKVIREREDIFFLTFQELQDVVRTRQADEALIAQRKETFMSYAALTPPRVITSDGEIVSGAYRRDELPTGALIGLPVSGGTSEGRARVILDMSQADLDPGDILVTTYTDPSWTPLFVTISGLVTEVGGQMTHGAVIAREYGLPAVVSVENATQLIRDGQRIRVHGTDGYVEVLS
ncbi:MAG: rifamycin-inactivating phosphotransferase [Thermomicrobiales bacterium]